jgi:hypothetical protein
LARRAASPSAATTIGALKSSDSAAVASRTRASTPGTTAPSPPSPPAATNSSIRRSVL